jgi:hypothetical protein
MDYGDRIAVSPSQPPNPKNDHSKRPIAVLGVATLVEIMQARAHSFDHDAISKTDNAKPSSPRPTMALPSGDEVSAFSPQRRPPDEWVALRVARP